MDEPRTTIVVKEIGVGATTGVGAASGRGLPILRRVLAVVVGLAVLAVMIPLGILALGCVAAVALLVLAVWAIGRIARPRATSQAGNVPDAADPNRENVRVREP